MTGEITKLDLKKYYLMKNIFIRLMIPRPKKLYKRIECPSHILWNKNITDKRNFTFVRHKFKVEAVEINAIIRS